MVNYAYAFSQSESGKYFVWINIVNLFFSTEQTATLLAELAAIETKKGTTITAPTSLSKEREQVQMSLLQLLTFFAIVQNLWLWWLQSLNAIQFWATNVNRKWGFFSFNMS